MEGAGSIAAGTRGIIAGLAAGSAFLGSRHPATIAIMKRAPAHLLALSALLLVPVASSALDHAVPKLPAAVSNNAVAGLRVGGETRLYSFLGLGAGKQWHDITRAAYRWSEGASRWTELPPVPVPQGRLASISAVAGGRIYLFGGYTVAEDGHEVSTPEVLRFDPAKETWSAVLAMPVPVDDSVAVVLDDRYIYLISGWHMDRNVALVQVYDAREDRWAQATPFPGEPVFGHAGALLGRSLVVCDGVILTVRGRKREFTASDACWRGDIDADNPLRIDWRRIASHPGAPRYRMGTAAAEAQGLLLFAGGSENPYNFDGIGYDRQPSLASARVQGYSPSLERWYTLPPLPVPSMDHRGMPSVDGRFYLIGGMRDGQQVAADVLVYTLGEVLP